MERDEWIIDRLVEAIYKKFRANGHKGYTWLGMSNEEILRYVRQEIDEMIEAHQYGDTKNAFFEAGDAAVYLAFYVDPKRIQDTAKVDNTVMTDFQTQKNDVLDYLKNQLRQVFVSVLKNYSGHISTTKDSKICYELAEATVPLVEVIFKNKLDT